MKLWFSGHFHLSHDYEDSVSVRGQCAFVQVGVIGPTSTRDERRHSRLLRAGPGGYELQTMDHATGTVRTDLVHAYGSGLAPRPIPPLATDPAATTPGNGWLAGLDACSLEGARSQWLFAGSSELTVQVRFPDPSPRTPRRQRALVGPSPHQPRAAGRPRAR